MVEELGLDGDRGFGGATGEEEGGEQEGGEFHALHDSPGRILAQKRTVKAEEKVMGVWGREYRVDCIGHGCLKT
jgi:hypothetical protein